MNVHKISGAGGFERGPERTRAADKARQQDDVRQSRARTDADSASISSAGRETLETVQALTERARADDASREALVADAKARLEAGALDDPAVVRQTAQRLLDQGF